MSVSLYRWTEACEGVPCPGDCDLCSREDAIDSLYFDTVDDHDRAKEKVKRLPFAQPEDYAHGFADGYKQGKKDAQPEIIRCKDCKHYEIWQLKSDYTDDKRYKPSVCVLGRYAVHRPEDWYCADAERRTDGSD